MANAKKGTKETLAKENNEDLKPVLVHFKGEKNVYEFKNAFLCGFLTMDESQEVSTIISGFTKLDDFVTVFNNILLQAYDFLQQNADNGKEQIVEALRTTTELIFEGIISGEFDDYFHSSLDLDESDSVSTV